MRVGMLVIIHPDICNDYLGVVEKCSAVFTKNVLIYEVVFDST